jgi:hypothetical protein
MPYEVRGGIVLHASKLWKFIREMTALEQDCFGDRLHRYRTEVKGHKLLDKDRFKWSRQMETLDPATRRQNAVAFLLKGMTKQDPPTKLEFTAYGQASMAMAHGVLDLLLKHEDQVFLLERYFYMLDEEQQTGLLVMDETERDPDRRFMRQMDRYFTRTASGQQRSKWIVPVPFFVKSDMTYPIQAADVCIYCINCGFRVKEMNDVPRNDIADEFIPKIRQLQWCGDVDADGGTTRKNYGIVYVPDPYTARK